MISEKFLTHYVIIRRNLPLGAVCAQIAHAAGESFYLLNDASVAQRKSTDKNSEAGGLSPSGRSNTLGSSNQETTSDHDAVQSAVSNGCSNVGANPIPSSIPPDGLIKTLASAKNGGLNPSRGATYSEGSSVLENTVPANQNTETSVSNPILRPYFKPEHTKVVILGARNENKLLKLERQLIAAGIPHVAIREPDVPYNGELMAIGLVPGDRDTLIRHVWDFQTLKGLDTPKYSEQTI